MTNVRRYFQPGLTVFLTHVTQNRRPILTDNIHLLQMAIARAQQKSPFDLLAWVVLPDHFHVLMVAPHEHVPDVMIRIKMSFGQLYRRTHGLNGSRVWQHRYWDHIIRDETDFEQHLHYIHYNPVKHGLVAKPSDYPHSSFRWFVENGWYQDDWTIRNTTEMSRDFGE